MRACTGHIFYFLMGMAVFPVLLLAQPIGEVDTAGTTWYDLQHIGSCGRTIAIDNIGNAHIVWTLGTNNSQRHVFYNLWNTEIETFEFVPGGMQINSASRAGYVTIGYDTYNDCPIPAFHQITHDSRAHAGASHCLQVVTEIPPISESGDSVQCIWPQVAVDIEGQVHVVSGESPFDIELYNRIFYSRGIPQFDGDGLPAGIEWQPVAGSDEFLYIDSTVVIGYTIAASRHSPLLAIGYHRSRTIRDWWWERPVTNDLMLLTSENGGLTWGIPENITQFRDSLWWEDSTGTYQCSGDTFSAYADVSLLFDENDIVHAAFATRGYYVCSYYGEYATQDAGMLWHWDEGTQNFSLITDAFYRPIIDSLFVVELGEWRLNVERPSLAIDPTNGYLYCAYMQYDTNCYSEDHFGMADIFVSVSTNNGANWSVGTNVTRTCPGENIPPPGSMHERDHTLAETVVNGQLHLTYVLDHDAGGMPYYEGIATLNEVIYQRIPVDSIPTMPLVPNYPLHYDSTGFVPVTERRVVVPQEIVLHAAYPNPFNTTTILQFDLPQQMEVTLKVFDLLGRDVEMLRAGVLHAGLHSQKWDAGGLASGIYFVLLETPARRNVQKVMLLK